MLAVGGSAGATSANSSTVPLSDASGDGGKGGGDAGAELLDDAALLEDAAQLDDVALPDDDSSAARVTDERNIDGVYTKAGDATNDDDGDRNARPRANVCDVFGGNADDNDSDDVDDKDDDDPASDAVDLAPRRAVGARLNGGGGDASLADSIGARHATDAATRDKRAGDDGVAWSDVCSAPSDRCATRVSDSVDARATQPATDKTAAGNTASLVHVYKQLNQRQS
jgi:hypothetical protein